MPWKMLSSWLATAQRSPDRMPMPFTLVTLRGRDAVSAEEVAFYADAEFTTLMSWAASGRFVMAFAALERDELTLVCTGCADVVRGQVAELPLVAAGLASADVRAVDSLHLTRRDPVAH